MESGADRKSGAERKGDMIEITGQTLTIEQVLAVARFGEAVAPLGPEVRARLNESRQWVEETLQRNETAVYGVNTGVGILSAHRIGPQQARRLSRNLVLTVANGVGEPLPREIARAMMLVRANSLALPYSGARPVVVDTLIEMLNRGVTPLIPEKGSLGASGDLCPLAHMALVLSCDPQDADDGSGQAWFEDQVLSGAEAMAAAGIPRLVLEAKEGLSLTNGTTFMAAAGAIALYDAEQLLLQAEIAAALSMEGLLGITQAFDPAIHEANRQPGQIQAAANLRALLQGSQLVDSYAGRIQDAYSLRCIPQVVGPVHDILGFLRQRLADALNATSDNPLIFPASPGDGAFRTLLGGNFHGQGLSMWLDFLANAMAAVGNIAERRIFRALIPELNAGLPPMLVDSQGLDSGLMFPQYTAAALVSDNKTLAHPDSVDSIPTSANHEDFVSMGANAARHTLEVVRNVRDIVAIELLTAAQAIDLRPQGPEKLGRGTRPAYDQVRQKAAFLEHDRALAPDIQALSELLAGGELLEAVKAVLGDDLIL
jgi:histidine ammonia-lyase